MPEGPSHLPTKVCHIQHGVTSVYSNVYLCILWYTRFGVQALPDRLLCTWDVHEFMVLPRAGHTCTDQFFFAWTMNEIKLFILSLL